MNDPIIIEIECVEIGLQGSFSLDSSMYDELEAKEIAERVALVFSRWWLCREFMHNNIDSYKHILFQ